MTIDRLFGTDGIRAKAGSPPLDALTIRRIGRALADLFEGPVLIGRDTRLSGVWIEELLHQELKQAQVETVRAGLLSTPGVSCLTRLGPYGVGIVISASHNPYQDNGIKFFQGNGEKFNPEQQGRLERRVAEMPSEAGSVEDPEASVERISASDQASLSQYMDFLIQSVGKASLDSLKIVLDCANGAACAYAPQVFRSLGAEVVEIGAEPDGRNINLDCGALHPQAMAHRVRESKAALGAAFDGDADRVIFADAQGNLLDGDHALLILARKLNQDGALQSGAVVSTVMANMGLEIALRREGIRMLRTDVGDRWVWESMRQGGHWLGGEQSGHLILRHHMPAGDGVLAALQIASLAGSSPQILSQAFGDLVKFPQLIVNVKVASKPDFSRIPAIRGEIKRVERELAGKGRVLVRYSGTEPKARIMLEGEPGTDLQPLADAIALKFRQELGEVKA